MKPNQKFTIEQILQILDDVIEEFSRPYEPNRVQRFYFWNLINSRGLTKQQMNHYRNVKPNQDVIDRFTTLQDLQELKLVEGMLFKDSPINPTTAMKILSCKYKWMDAVSERKLELEEKKLDKESALMDGIGQALNVNFNVVEHRSDEEIQELLDASDK